MRFRALLLACGLYASAAVAADDAPAPPMPDFSVLTPSMTGRFVVATQLNLNMVYPLLGGPGDLANNSRTKILRRLVDAERYDPARTLADRLIEALGDGGYTAVYQAIRRKPPGSIQSLSWSDLPEQPLGELFLDVNIQWICLCSSASYAKTYPAIELGWRLLHPRQEIVEPTRTITYYHIPWDPTSKKEVSPTGKPPKMSPYPPVVVSESCGFGSLDDAEKNPALLWGCFGEAYDAAVKRLVTDLARIRPPAAAVTASGDNRS
jgi:hypothetical protein